MGDKGSPASYGEGIIIGGLVLLFLVKSKTYKRGFPETQCLCSQGNYAQTPR